VVQNSLKFQYHMLVLAIILAPMTMLICNEVIHVYDILVNQARISGCYIIYENSIISYF